MTRDELLRQVNEALRSATLLRAAIEAGDVPSMADARLLRGHAEVVEELVGLAIVGALREQTPEQDKHSQVVMAAQHNARADELEDEVAKWSAAG